MNRVSKAVILFASLAIISVSAVLAADEAEEEGTVDETVAEEAAVEEGAAEEVAENDEEVVEEEKPKFLRYTTQIEEKPPGDLQPWNLLRSIQRAQDRIATGKPDAIKAYRVLLRHAATWMKRLDNGVWQYERNLDAVAVYILIGGDVELGYKALQESRLSPASKVLLRGSVAFGEQDAVTADRYFREVDHTILPPSMAAQVALAKSMVASSYDLELASDLLREVQKFAPGTLVEEAAIRRAIRVTAELKREEAMIGLMRTYLFRFSQSYYFNDFLRNISYGLMNIQSDQDGMNIVPAFERLLEGTSRAQKIALAEYAMRRAVIAGHHDFVLWLYDQVEDLAPGGSKAHTRLRLYSLAAMITDQSSTETIVEDAPDLTIRHLGPKDRELLDAVQATAQTILIEDTYFNPGSDEEQGALEQSGSPKPESNENAYDGALAGEDERYGKQMAELEKLLKGDLQ